MFHITLMLYDEAVAQLQVLQLCCLSQASLAALSITCLPLSLNSSTLHFIPQRLLQCSPCSKQIHRFDLLCAVRVTRGQWQRQQTRNEKRKSCEWTSVARTPLFTFCWQGRVVMMRTEPTYMDNKWQNNNDKKVTKKHNDIKRKVLRNDQMSELLSSLSKPASRMKNE